MKYLLDYYISGPFCFSSNKNCGFHDVHDGVRTYLLKVLQKSLKWL